MTININQVKEWLLDFCLVVIDNEKYLNDLDAQIGDGDHGTNMAKGCQVILSVLNDKYIDESQLFYKVGLLLITNVGGASGALYGSAFIEMSKVINNDNNLSKIILAGKEIISKRGRSTRYEKTMLDIWFIAYEALNVNKLNYELLEQELLKTKDIVATKGRASYLGQRSKGHIDPGSQSSVYLFNSLIKKVLE